MTKKRETSPPTPDAKDAPTVKAPPLAQAGVPICYVVDEEPSIRHFLSLVLHGAGVDTIEFADGAAMRKAARESKSAPLLVFHDVSLESTDAIESILVLAKRGFHGAVQLMSNRGGAVLDHVKNVGMQNKLNMMAVLKKPFETDAVMKILHELKLGLPPPMATRLDLQEALDKKWIEFWYQPKIDLRRKRLAGAEAYARARHPENGIVLPAAFLPGATEPTMLKLSELVLVNALNAAANFAKLGVHLALSINMPIDALAKLPMADLIKAHRPPGDKWPGLLIDVPEDQIVANLAAATDLAKSLEPLNVRIAIDGFGHGHPALAQLGEMPFAEIKLGRAFVADCGTDKVNAPLCKTAIDLAHNFGRLAVAMGIEKAADVMALLSMGCDYGQGFLLGQPMPEERFATLVRQRSGALDHNPTAGVAQPA